MAPPVVNLCVLRLPLKYAAESAFPFRQSSLDALGITSNDKRSLDAFFEELQERRTLLLTFLQKEETQEDSIDGALDAYFATLNHLLVPVESRGTPLSSGFSFVWRDVLSCNQTVVYKSVEYEIVNVLLSTALWKCHQGAMRIIFTEEGLSTSSASKAFLLYRRAIGLVEYCQRLLGERESPKTDANRPVLTGLTHLCFAEVQGITVLRAVEKENAPTLIASLAMYAHQRYEQCAQTISHDPTIMSGSYLQKIYAYAHYKAACFKSYMLVYHGYAKLSACSGGAAVRLTIEAEKIIHRASELGRLYDRTAPETNLSERDTFHKSLQRVVSKAKKQAESDNRHVYYERVPADLPELPAPKQLVGSIVYEFPEPNPSVRRNIFAGLTTSPAMQTAAETVIEIVPGSNRPLPSFEGIEQDPNKKSDTEQKKSSWWKWLLVIIALPLLSCISLIGFGVWIILIPFKIFFCPVGLLAECVWDVVEYLIKAPLRAMRWAAGEPWQPVPPTTAVGAEP